MNALPRRARTPPAQPSRGVLLARTLLPTLLLLLVLAFVLDPFFAPLLLLPLAAAAAAERILVTAETARRQQARTPPAPAPDPVDTSETLADELDQALTDGQITVAFQPIVDARTGAVVAAETLVRWHHPTRGMIGPDEFIPAVEATGRIGVLTTHVGHLALAACRRWLDADTRLTVAVNLSPLCLTRPELVDSVRAALAHHRVPAELLTLELTESAVLTDPARGSATLAALRALGVRLSMDDFGTGYSSLAYLREIPVDEVKIDKSFVLGISSSLGEAHIPRSIIDLAHNLGLRVVAEGVEDELTRRLLAEMGCDKLQGYLISRPMPADQMDYWLSVRRRSRRVPPASPPDTGLDRPA